MKRLLLVGLLFILCGCERDRFEVGEIVKMKLDGRKAMVIEYNGLHSPGPWKIRVVGNQSRTDVRLFGHDEPITSAPYTIIWVNPCEIEKR